MALLKAILPRRIALAALLTALLGSLLPSATALALVTGSVAMGGSAISADDTASSNWTTLTGPVFNENVAGSFAPGDSIILKLPTGFKFNTAVGTLSIGGAGCNLTSTAGLVTANSTTSWKVLTASTVNTCVVTYVGLQVQPTAGTPLASGPITQIGTTLALPNPGFFGALTEVPGAVATLQFTTQPSANTAGGIAFATQPQVRAFDQYSNPVPNAPVVLSITPGSGTPGATVVCTNPANTSTTNGTGFTTFAGCKVDKAGTYTLRATSNGKTADSGNFIIHVGIANKMVFTSYPNATTPSLLSPQPAVAITDAGGNVITTDTRTVNLAINQNPGSFTCSGGLSTAAVAGIATFSGCTQSTVAAGYSLTATSTTPVPTVAGPAFAVNPLTLVFVAQPPNSSAGIVFASNVQVAIQDGAGHTITSGISATVGLAIATNPAGGALTCSGGTSVGTVNGVATFTGCSINNVGNGYTLAATASNVIPAQTITGATSTAFNVTTAILNATLSITSFCGLPTPKSLAGTNQCAPDTTKSPPQANIKLPQTTNEGVYLVAQFGSNGASRSVRFQVSKDQVTWNDINTTTTDGTGLARYFYRPSDNRYYRVVFAGAADLAAVTSPTLRVVVRALVFLRPTGCTSAKPCRIHADDDITFTVTARPNRPELPLQTAVFTVQKKSGSSWVDAGIDQLEIPISKVDGTGHFTVPWTPGTWRLRVNLAPTSVNANSFPTAFEYYIVS